MLAVKAILDKGRTKCLRIPKGTKSETKRAHKNKMQKYPVNTTSQNKINHAYVGLNPSWKKMLSAGPK